MPQATRTARGLARGSLSLQLDLAAAALLLLVVALGLAIAPAADLKPASTQCGSLVDQFGVPRLALLAIVYVVHGLLMMLMVAARRTTTARVLLSTSPPKLARSSQTLASTSRRLLVLCLLQSAVAVIVALHCNSLMVFQEHSKVGDGPSSSTTQSHDGRDQPAKKLTAQNRRVRAAMSEKFHENVAGAKPKVERPSWLQPGVGIATVYGGKKNKTHLVLMFVRWNKSHGRAMVVRLFGCTDKDQDFPEMIENGCTRQ